MKTEAELVKLFYFKFQEIPLLARMEAIQEYFTDEYETLYNRKLTEEEEEGLTREFIGYVCNQRCVCAV